MVAPSARTRSASSRLAAGLTVLTSMANVLPHLDRADHGLALVHGLAFVSRDTRGRAPRFSLLPLGGRKSFETLVRNRVAALNRKAIGAGGKSSLGTLDSGELFA